ncbi:hypothetical protein DFJ58DRAFT_718979 [Suillus subalutaceus]|uniref:uncharacterized protein n=1 Tax=Suillus subalutaceus TaxID=48586 RepID=UPI001B8751F6|nr:uncharacterized protein DFJ58DRAFT_718979 [Suillus subalutaceus]KAG1836945.1 hypothetical protein DFJ58DRAFT_718979 [Suillus subalutaceus]
MSATESYLVQHGSGFVNEYARRDTTDDPNHLLGAFPCLFPYGLGGFEVSRPRPVSYEAHAKWAMQYGDKRFRKDFHFMFQVFGVIQKHQVCRSTVLQVQKKAFLDNKASFTHLTADDLALAGRQEAKKEAISNPVIRALKKHLTAVRVNVVGTDESKISIHAYIWGMTVLRNPPSLWITINPTDTHDPIVQVFAGEEIDLDLFDRTAGPDSAQHAKIVADDPYAAAKFFHFVVRAIFEELMGITIHKRAARGSQIVRRKGIFGTLEGYIGNRGNFGYGTSRQSSFVLSASRSPFTPPFQPLITTWKVDWFMLFRSINVDLDV